MGVKGLTTFVNSYQRVLLEDYQLHSTKLVTDGLCLVNSFYTRDLDPGNHGGESQKFYTKSAAFFKNLKVCGIEPFIVLDGVYEVDGKKMDTILQRKQYRLNLLKAINEGKYENLYPPMITDVFRRVMKDFEINFVVTEFEADRDLAVLANALQCPVLGNDSDFYIMDIHQGYIPINGLLWKNVSKVPTSTSWRDEFVLQCQRYKRTKFCSYFHIHPSLMPLFASLHGNDYLKVWSSDLETVIAAVSATYGSSEKAVTFMRRSSQNNHEKAIDQLLHFLSYFSTQEECLNEIMKQTKKGREKLRGNLLASCSMYDITKPSTVVDFFLSREQPLFKHPLVTKFSVPLYFVKLWQAGLVPKIALNSLLNKMHILRPQIEKLSEVSSTTYCKSLVRVLLGIMLVDVCDDLKEGDESLTVDIPCREGHILKSDHIEPLYVIANYGKVPSFKEIPSISKQERMSLLIASLNVRDVRLENAPQSLCLVLLITIYWFRNASPPVSQHHLCSLMLGWVQGVAWCKFNTYEIPHRSHEGFNFDFHWDQREINRVLHNFKPLQLRSFKPSLDLDVSHAFAQWLDCARSTYDLNQILLGVFPNAEMTVLFNGMLMHNICFKLKKMDPCSQSKWIENSLLAEAPNACKLFKALKTFLSRYLELHWPW